MLDRELEDLMRQRRGIDMALRRTPDDQELKDKLVLVEVAIDSYRELHDERGRNR